MRAEARAGWIAALILALAWGVGPALPALLRGELLGQPFTDLYPSVWGLWGFARAQPALPGHTELLGFPEGMGFYYSSPLKGWLAWPLLAVLDLPSTWNLLTVAARVGTVLAAWGAARAWGFGPRGALAVAGIYGCAPFFQGYAVEGIAEGTDGWTLALLALALGRGNPIGAALALALTVLSSWYLGMCGCLLVCLAALRDARALAALAGLLLAAPALLTFLHAFPGTAPLDPAVRAAMGAPLHLLARPGLAEGLNPFAITAWVGLLTVGAALWSRSRYLLLAAVPALLSLGLGPLYDLPVLELVRFPYRWHALTLLLLGAAAGTTADRWRWGWLLGPLVVLEGLLLSPIEPLIPGAPAEIPALYAQVDGPLLVVPGPVARPPGEINPSRPRARSFLYFQTAHGQPSPWVPDFNSVGVSAASSLVTPFQAWDPVEQPEAPSRLEAGALGRLRRAGVQLLMVERAGLRDRAPAFEAELRRQGAHLVGETEERALYGLGPPVAPADRAG